MNCENLHFAGIASSTAEMIFFTQSSGKLSSGRHETIAFIFGRFSAPKMFAMFSALSFMTFIFGNRAFKISAR